MSLKENNRIFSLWFTLGLCLCLASALYYIPAVDAATVWSDNFTDGDTNGWTVHLGGFSASSNYLQGTQSTANHISRTSTEAYGTWRFDLHIWEDSVVTDTMSLFFMASDLNAGNDYYPDNGYAIQIGHGFIGTTSAFALVRYDNAVRNAMDIYTPANTQGTFHFDITRDVDDHIYVYIDDTLVMDRVNSAHSTSESFFWFATGTGNWLDNIVVSDTVDITPPTTPTTPTTTDPPPIPGFPAVAIAVGIVSALSIGVLYRRRQSPTHHE
ncbi:MAG: hypothetical protein ACXADB_10850 [Candidatus Hermodarchaeia archaeon]